MSKLRIRILIVDDEPIARRGLRQLLAPHDDVEVAGEARNGKEAVRLLRALNPDLVFLDVQMPEMDGFSVLRQLEGDSLPAVIFVTAYDSFAVRAFEAHAIDYLVKPVSESRFRDALSRVREQFRSREAIDLSQRLSRLLASDPSALSGFGAATPPARRLVVGTAGSDLILEMSDIVWIEAEDYYAAVHAGGRRHLVRESLASLEERLDESQFVRAHRAAIVNLAHVSEIRSDAAGESVIVLRDGTQLPLSRRRKRKVEQAMRKFAG